MGPQITSGDLFLLSCQTMLQTLEQLQTDALGEIEAIDSIDALESWRIAYLGSKGRLKGVMPLLKDVSKEDKPEVGKRLNEVKTVLEEAFKSRKSELAGGATARPPLDITEPGDDVAQGRRHIITRTIDGITEVFGKMGFSVAYGPEVEDEYHNFNALNIPEDHPARDSIDNFFMDGDRMLRSQTSTVQIRVMESTPPPIKIIAVGRVYRPDTHDATHYSMFHQCEGLLVAPKVSMVDFEDAKDKVMMGVERKSMILTPKEKKVTAYHEAGHALVAHHTVGADPVHKITIIPRGMALGVTAQLPEEEKHNYQKNYLLGKLDILMGGRSAEKLIFNDTSTGAGNDISTATDISRKMVCEWGMSDRIGPLTFGKKSEEVFLGREISHSRDYSDEISQIIDEEISIFVKTAEENADTILKTNIDELKNIANALLEYEAISGDEMKKVINGEAIVRIEPKEKKKRVRRRKKVEDNMPENSDSTQPIITKPAT